MTSTNLPIVAHEASHLKPDVADDMRDRATRIRKMQQDAVVGAVQQSSTLDGHLGS